MVRAWILGGVLLAASHWSMAAGNPKLPPIDVIRAEQQRIEAEVRSGKGIYSQMPASTRAELLKRQTGLTALLQGKSSIDELSETERAQAEGALEWISATIANAMDEREVCRAEKKTGSNRHTRVCRTVRQMREDREEVERAMNRAAVCTDGKLCSGR